MIKFDDSNKIIEFDPRYLRNRYLMIKKGIDEKTLPGSKEFTGWIELLDNYDFNYLDTIETTVKNFQSKAKLMIVIGIGGSYLGSKAIYEAMKGLDLHPEYQLMFVGNNLSADYLNEIYEYCWQNDFVVNVISKSGTTLEPAIAFRIFKELLIKKYGEDSLKERLIITTDPDSGALRSFANDHQITAFDVPKDIGGRYSVFSAVGLVPLAFANIQIKDLLRGAIKAHHENFTELNNNQAYEYAIDRLMLHTAAQKKVENFVVYEPRMQYFCEWLKQLFAESEGKEGHGLLPTSMTFSTDLHSIGQMIQDGNKFLFETIFDFKGVKHDIKIPFDESDFDGLNKYTKYTLNQIQEKALQGVVKAHVSGDVPNLIFEIDHIDETHLGYLMSMMMYACMYSAYLLKVNPFDQPAVELYKKEVNNMLNEE